MLTENWPPVLNSAVTVHVTMVEAVARASALAIEVVTSETDADPREMMRIATDDNTPTAARDRGRATAAGVMMLSRCEVTLDRAAVDAETDADRDVAARGRALDVDATAMDREDVARGRALDVGVLSTMSWKTWLRSMAWNATFPVPIVLVR
jgi:hypothetical protein